MGKEGDLANCESFTKIGHEVKEKGELALKEGGRGVVVMVSVCVCLQRVAKGKLTVKYQ